MYEQTDIVMSTWAAFRIGYDLWEHDQDIKARAANNNRITAIPLGGVRLCWACHHHYVITAFFPFIWECSHPHVAFALFCSLCQHVSRYFQELTFSISLEKDHVHSTPVFFLFFCIFPHKNEKIILRCPDLSIELTHIILQAHYVMVTLMVNWPIKSTERTDTEKKRFASLVLKTREKPQLSTKNVMKENIYVC